MEEEGGGVKTSGKSSPSHRDGFETMRREPVFTVLPVRHQQREERAVLAGWWGDKIREKAGFVLLIHRPASVLLPF